MRKSMIFPVSVLLICCFIVACKDNAAEQSGKKETLTFLTFLSPTDDAPRSIAQNQIIDGFLEKNPNVTIEYQVVGWAEVAPRLLRAVAAGNPPDVTRMASDYFQQQFGAGTLQDLSPFINKSVSNIDAFKQDFALNYDLDLDKGAKRTLWIDNRAVMMYYNKNHLKEIGVAEPPKSWDELGLVAQKLTARGYVGLVIGLGPGGGGNQFMEPFKVMLWASGSDLLDGNGKAIFNNAAGGRAMNMLYDLVYKYQAIPMDILNTDADGAFQAFQSGRASIIFFANHRFTTAQATLGDDVVGICPMPSWDGNEPGQGHITGWALAIPKGAKKPDLAWKFIEHHISPESEFINAKIAGELPPRISVYENSWFTDDPLGKQMVQWKQYINDYGRMPQFPEDYLKLQDILCNAAQKIVLEKQSVQATLDAAVIEYETR